MRRYFLRFVKKRKNKNAAEARSETRRGRGTMNIIRAIKKLFQRKYEPRPFWDDRYKHWGADIRGSGHEGRGVEYNERLYEARWQVIKQALEDIGYDTQRLGEYNRKFCDIGCGNGWLTKHLHDLKVKKYDGYDISYIPLARLKDIYTDYAFHWVDICEDKPLLDEYHFIFCIDVIEHITDKGKLQNAINNLKSGAPSGGFYIFIAPVFPKHKNSVTSYQTLWGEEEIKNMFRPIRCRAEYTMPEGDRKLLVFQRPLEG